MVRADAFTHHLPTEIRAVNRTAHWLFTLGQIPRRS